MAGAAAAEGTQKGGKNRRLLLGVGVLVGLALTFLVLFSHQGLFRIYCLRQERQAVEAEAARLEAENARLARTIDRLQHDPEMIQDLIRRELNFIRKNEIIFQFPPESGNVSSVSPALPQAKPGQHPSGAGGKDGRSRSLSLERLKEALDREPCAGAMHLLAETYYQQGLYPQAAAASRRALSLYPENPEIRLILGQSLVSLGELAEAEEILQPVVREIGRLGEVFDILQRLYAGQGREAEANQAGHLYRLLKGPLFALLKREEPFAAPLSPSPPKADRKHAARTLEVLEKWQGALQSH